MCRSGSCAHVLGLCLLLLAGCAASGCAKNEKARSADAKSTTGSMSPSAQDPSAQDPSTQDSIFAFLAMIDQEAFRSSFEHLDEKTFTRYTRTEQFDENDLLLAFEERVIRHSGPPARRNFDLVDQDSGGVFDYGYLRSFVSDSELSRDPMDFAHRIVPEDPAYMSPRNRDAYVYRSLPDTLMGDVSARVIEIRARPQVGDGQNVRYVRLYVDRNSNRLIAMYLERVDRAMWYREESIFCVHLRRMPGTSWLPYNTRFETRITVPFRPTQRFRTASTYYRYAAGSS